MERDVLQERIARLTTLENVGGVFRDGLAIYLRARAFAIKAHLGQMDGERFYTCHLEEVENVLIRFEYCSFRMRAAAWLHDTVEKCGVTMNDINREFSGFVASTVGAVTSAPGETREERNSTTYLRIKARGTTAIVLKMADRIASLEEANSARILENGSSFGETEYADFRDALYESGNADAMWAHLDALVEGRTEAMNRKNLTAFADSVSPSNPMRPEELPAPVNHASRE